MCGSLNNCQIEGKTKLEYFMLCGWDLRNVFRMLRSKIKCLIQWHRNFLTKLSRIMDPVIAVRLALLESDDV